MNKLETAILNTLMRSTDNAISRTNLLRSVYHLLKGGADEFNTELERMVNEGSLQVRKKGRGLIYSAFSTPSDLLEDSSSVITEEKIRELRAKGGKLCPMCKGHGYVPRSLDTSKFDTHLQEEKEVEEHEEEEVASILEKLAETK